MIISFCIFKVWFILKSKKILNVGILLNMVVVEICDRVVSLEDIFVFDVL